MSSNFHRDYTGALILCGAVIPGCEPDFYPAQPTKSAAAAVHAIRIETLACSTV